MLVRLATIEDLRAIVPLLVAQLAEHGTPARDTAISRQVTKVMSDPDNGFVLVGEHDGAVQGVAYVTFAHPLEHDGEVAFIEELYVAPALRSQGLGQMLVRAAMSRAESRGCVSVDLMVQADHQRAANLYQREGFRPMQRQQFTRPLTAWDWGAKFTRNGE